MHTRAAILLLLSCLVGAPAALAEVEVRFSPYGGCDREILRLAQNAQKQLDAACHSLTLAPVADALIAAKQRGVNVRVIFDKSRASQPDSQTAKLHAAGIPIKVNAHRGLMHHMFLVADAKHAATGSFDWTQDAVRQNDENLVVFRDEPRLATAFALQFDKMWADTKRFSDFKPTSAALAGSAPSAPAPTLTQPQSPPGIRGDIVYITKTGKKYHRAGCRYLSKSSIPIPRAEAEAKGLAPCKVCKP